ncbi:Uncharacterized protein OBRU01_17799 [Operophtera brumata]|uniref:Uncharacterized protein n=1 Tax=Operophtera brumata TaxID=104452 RepID=A0A0L7KZZ7_OPEBR|nr:Uncharacterized protein OBRU01_17799 [Operophtera brumata]
MQGSLTLGKEVVDTLAHYFKNPKSNIDGRRAMSLNDHTSDTISLIVNSAFLCRDLSLCNGTLTKFLNEYIITLTRTVENVFEGLLQISAKDKLENKIPKGVLFEAELKIILRSVKKFLSYADKKMVDDDESYVWMDLIKKINAKFQERADTFASQRLQGNAQEIGEVKAKLTQKLVIETSIVELEFCHKLCAKEKICIENFEVTKAFKTLLEELQGLPDSMTKSFIRYFHESLPDTSFYYRISDVTSNEFQAILNDMAYAENIHTKNVLLAIQNTVNDRLNSIKSKTYNSTGRDVKLVHVILSDMDHFYNQQGVDPFHKFRGKFYEWANSKTDSRFSSSIRQVMRDIANTLSLQSNELVLKLVNEVRAFLEITVDPQK